ncbi:uncharacterized protein PHACADRAFT_260917 [Phanerochaete carnosa HHB-10118-sp]|uniref:Heterokaryon incompatibility domain-containing protein n=1 Tax=Phanerochaete carnosa (strain HHB-10118-sp) TaxID=650164 RepID=K5WQ57_PHACS|nr:uncharacterized protein PHACADRAFT_260917 [Phanerochaete carnosa HHB-10118-sp]EKM52477.1 hypothetical protein PHACADRAFT_260917 [Phanerochaete carnosa HHB-10118-sp]
MMDESRGSLEASSAKQRTSGPILTLTPPASINRRTVCPLQMKFKGTGAICDSDANIFCADLGVDGLLDKLNHVFGTNYSLDKIPNLEALLDEMVNDESNYDFGYAYGRVRRGWFCDVDYLHERLNGHAEADSGRRQRAIDDDLIIDPRVPPRRVWDLYSNRVLPFHVLLGADVPRNLWAISHSWVPDSQLQRVWTRINSCMWPVPIPLSVYLSQIRIELLNLGAEYVWLDALCLRQEIPPTTMLNYPYRDTVDSQWLRRREKTRREEWRLDVPTIGYVYRCRPSQVVVTYFNGLGRPFRLSANSKSAWGIANTNHWINRVWTMQEATPNWLLGGLTLQPFDDNEPGLWDTITLFHQRMSDLLAVLPQGYTPPDLFALVTFLRLRHSRRENDYISGLGYLLQCPVIPIYDETISAETAWKRLVRELDPKFLTDLLFLFPVPGADRRARWRPSWKQLLRHPLTPRSTPPVSYLQQDLVQYDPASDVFSNVAYVVDRCVFHPTETAGSLEVEVLIGPRDGEQAKSWSFTIIVNCTSPSLETDTEYTIVATADLKYWLYGNTVNETSGSLTFQKLGIFDVDDAEDMDRLWHLNPGYADMRVIYA